MNPAVLALAALRLTTLIVHDEVTRPLRIIVDRWAGDAPAFTIRERVSTLLGCDRCTGIWAAAAVLGMSQVRVLRPAVNVLATAQAALALHTVLEKLDR